MYLSNLFEPIYTTHNIFISVLMPECYWILFKLLSMEFRKLRNFTVDLMKIPSKSESNNNEERNWFGK